jgi:hypothetical protein
MEHVFAAVTAHTVFVHCARVRYSIDLQVRRIEVEAAHVVAAVRASMGISLES